MYLDLARELKNPLEDEDDGNIHCKNPQRIIKGPENLEIIGQVETI